jgi:NAD(P)-dependent dehydrogenase (short-subunit alcohol dehydrogenase family)
MHSAGIPVLISGAANGIGRALAHKFAATGARVGCLDVDGEGLEAFAREMTATNASTLALPCDVSDASQVQQAVSQFAEWAGGLSLLINNAGIVIRKRLLETSVEEWDRTMATNLRGAFLLTQSAVPYLARAQDSCIVMMTSVVAHIGFGLPAYTASKGGLVALVRELAGELAHLGIRVNGVSPGTVEGTAVTRTSLADPAVRSRTLKNIPLGRIATTQDIVSAIYYLTSQEARMVTGHVLNIDGGLSASIYDMQRPIPLDGP